ncbi:MAG: acyl-CoA dehydrogenase family protein, partial [Cyanobacteria bacterium J06641_2]
NCSQLLQNPRRSIPPHIVLDFGNRGLLGMQVPREYGGLGLNNYDTMRVLQQLGAIDPTLSLFVGLNNILGIRPILRYGSRALKDELLPILATGRELAAFAITEPAAGSNPQGMTSQAIPDGDEWRLNGTKIWSGSAAWAGVTNVFVRHQNPDGSWQGISGFAVRKGTGLRQGKEALTMGMRGMVQNTVYLNDVSVSAEQMLGQPGAGMQVAQDAMMYGRLAIAAASVGGMKRCTQLMLRYSSRRSVSTGKLLENPFVLKRLSEITAAITATENLVSQVAQRLDAGETIPPEIYTACKTAAPEFYWQAADSLVQVLGGRGYIETNIAPQILRDARILRIFEGPTETLNMFLGSRAIHESGSLISFISESLQAPEIAEKLQTAASQIYEKTSPRAIAHPSPY